jgi:hypothetical protein
MCVRVRFGDPDGARYTTVRGTRMYANVRNADCGGNTMQLVERLKAASTAAFSGRHINAVCLRILLENYTMQRLKHFSSFFIAILMVSVLGCAGTATKEGTGEYVDDSVITTKVKAAIFNEPTLKVAEINVETFKSVVQLSGFVKSRADMTKAVDLARGIKGVTSVKNDMRLK